MHNRRAFTIEERLPNGKWSLIYRAQTALRVVKDEAHRIARTFRTDTRVSDGERIIVAYGK